MRGFSAGHGEKKTRRLDQFIAAMLKHGTVEAAAKVAGIAASTAWRWMRDPDVLARLREVRKDAMNAGHGALAGGRGRSRGLLVRGSAGSRIGKRESERRAMYSGAGPARRRGRRPRGTARQAGSYRPGPQLGKRWTAPCGAQGRQWPCVRPH